MRENLKKFLCKYRQSNLFVVKYNKVVKSVTNTIDGVLTVCNYYIYGLFRINPRNNDKLCVWKN